MTSYITPADLKASLSLEDQSYADQDVELAIAAASRGIDGMTGRRFYKDQDANRIRYYTPTRHDTLHINDLVELTTRRVDGEEWEEGDYRLLPLNAAADGHPYTTIIPVGRRRFPAGVVGGVEVVGRFGWPEVPDAVKAATSILATKLLKRTREAPFGVVAFALDDGTAIRIARNDPDVRFLVDSYMRNQARSVSLG